MSSVLGGPHFAELVEPVVGDWHHCLVGVNGAKGIVLGRYMQLGEHIECGGLADVGESHDAHLEGVAGSPPERLKLSLLFLLWWHRFNSFI